MNHTQLYPKLNNNNTTNIQKSHFSFLLKNENILLDSTDLNELLR